MRVIKKIKKEQEKVRQEIIQKSLGYLIAAFGLVAGLAWNEAVKSLIEFFFPFSDDSLLAKFAYAVLMTVLVIVVTVYLSKALGFSQEKNKEK